MEKIKENQEKLNEYAKMNTKNISSSAGNTNKSMAAKANSNKGNVSQSDKIDTSSTTSSKSAQAGSMFEKANRVKQYNEKNNK